MKPVKLSHLVRGLFLVAAAGAQASVMAQQVVPPPMMPGAATPAPVQAPAPATEVLPAQQITGNTPIELMASAATPGAPEVTPRGGDIVDILLPEPPSAAQTKEALKPQAPSKKKKAEKKDAAPADVVEVKQERVSLKVASDPFAGVVALPVSDSQLNRFVFPEPIEGVYFPEGVPLPVCPPDAGEHDPCKPVFLNGRRMMLLQLRAGANGPMQMLVNLKSGRMVTLNLTPTKGPGAVIRVDGAEDGPSDVRLAEGKHAPGAAAALAGGGMAATEQDVQLLSLFARGAIPGHFEPARLGSTVRYDLFDVIPLAAWESGRGQRVSLFQVKAHDQRPVAISTALFRSPKIKALALDQETITASSPAQLYVLEAQEGTW